MATNPCGRVMFLYNDRRVSANLPPAQAHPGATAARQQPKREYANAALVSRRPEAACVFVGHVPRDGDHRRLSCWRLGPSKIGRQEAPWEPWGRRKHQQRAMG